MKGEGRKRGDGGSESGGRLMHNDSGCKYSVFMCRCRQRKSCLHISIHLY